jgi:hypothetical protein
VTRVDSILDNHLSRLLDGRLKPHGAEPGFRHVRNLGRVWTIESFWANPQQAILIFLVKVNMEKLGTFVAPRFA